MYHQGYLQPKQDFRDSLLSNDQDRILLVPDLIATDFLNAENLLVEAARRVTASSLNSTDIRQLLPSNPSIKQTVYSDFDSQINFLSKAGLECAPYIWEQLDELPFSTATEGQSQFSLANANTLSTSSSSYSPQASNTNVDDLVGALLSGNQWTLPPNRTLTYSFYEDDVFGGSYYGGETGVREVSEAIKTNVRAILASMSTMIDVNFVEVQETDINTFGQLRFQLSDNPSYAYAYYPSSGNLGGDVHLNPDYDRLGDANGFQHLVVPTLFFIMIGQSGGDRATTRVAPTLFFIMIGQSGGDRATTRVAPTILLSKNINFQ